MAVQAQEHAYARWSIAQRVKGTATPAAVDRAFDEGRLLRTHVLRPTWHYAAPADLRWLIRLTGPRLVATSARRYQNLELDATTLAVGTDIIARTVEERPHTRRELAAILQAKGIDPAGQRLPHLLMHAELHAAICSGPMAGKQHTYVPFDQRVPLDAGPDGEEALATLARRYFATRGPATLRDFTWWSGLRAAEARRGLELAKDGLSERLLDGRHYYFCQLPITAQPHAVDLVQCYDESIIAYSESRDVLQTGAARFPVPFNAEGFPHVLLHDGRLLGRWRRRDDRTGPRVETRIGVALAPGTEKSLQLSVERYCRFAAPKSDG